MSTSFHNFIFWTAQVLTITTAAALLLALVKNRQPRTSIIFCYSCLLACFAVPLATQWQHPVVESHSESIGVADTSLVVASTTAPPKTIPWGTWLIVFGLTGYALVVGRSLLGLYQLRRLRAHSRALTPMPESVRTAIEAVGQKAAVCVSEANVGPVTFGLVRPVVLVPSSFFDLSPESQRSVICHELVHVRRRDWLWSIIDEGVRTLLWFQPAVWYLLSQIRLAREQLVDAEVVQLNAERQPYIDALLTLSGVETSLVIPGLLGQRHLSQRLHFLLSQPVNSRMRMAMVATAMTLVIAVATIGAGSWFPLIAPLQAQATPSDGVGVSVDAGGVILHRTGIFYPWQAAQSHVQGTILAKLSLNAAGEVTDVSILSGPEEFRRDVLTSLLQWHYAPDAGPRAVQARIDFSDPANVPAPEPQATSNSFLESIDVSMLPDSMRSDVWQRVRAFKGQPFSESLISDVENAVSGADSHLALRWSTTEDGNHTLRVTFRNRLPASAAAAPSPIANPAPAAVPQPFNLNIKVTPSEAGKTPLDRQDEVKGTAGVPAGTVFHVGGGISAPTVLTQSSPAASSSPVYHVGGSVRAPTIVYKVDPQYTPDARAARVNGTVVLEAVVQADGTVQILRVVQSLGMGLDEAAIEALTQWRFNPATKDGVPVPVTLNIEVNFNLR